MYQTLTDNTFGDEADKLFNKSNDYFAEITGDIFDDEKEQAVPKGNC